MSLKGLTTFQQPPSESAMVPNWRPPKALKWTTARFI